MVTVLVADGQRLFAEALATALRAAPDLQVVAEYPTTGPVAAQAVIRHHPDVVLLDYWMPGMDGPSTTRAILAWSPRTKVLLVSWFHGPAHVQEALDAGACGFLPKSLRLDQVMAAVRRASDGEALVYGAELAQLVEDIEGRLDEADDQTERLLALSPREVEVLQLLGEGRSARQISEDLFISAGTVKNHIHRILAKTGAQSQLEAVAMARRAALIQDRYYPGTRRPRHDA